MKVIKRIHSYLSSVFWLGAGCLSAPFFYFYFLLRKKSPQKPQRILVIQTAKIGDMVCTTPVFREIKKHYPETHLAVLIIPKTKDVLKNNPHLNEIILFEKGIFRLIKKIRSRRFDWSFSLVPGLLDTLIPFWSNISHRVSTTSKYSSRGIKILSILNNYRLAYQRNVLALTHYLRLLKFINIREFMEQKEIFIGPEQEEKALEFLKEHKLNQGDFLVGISITAGKRFKEWEPKKFARLSDRLVEELNAKIIFTGSPEDGKIIRMVQSLMKNKSFRAIKFNLIEIAALLKKMSLFISVDTGSLYLADAVGTPVIDIAGPCAINSQGPSGKFIIVQKPISCGPCSFIMSAPSYCKHGHLKCVKDINVDDVFKAVKQLIK